MDNLFKITAQTSAGIKCFLILWKVVILMNDCMVGKKGFHLLGMNESCTPPPPSHVSSLILQMPLLKDGTWLVSAYKGPSYRR